MKDSVVKDLPTVLLAPFPRTLAEIFEPDDLQRLATFSRLAWARDEPLDPSFLESALPDLWSLVGYDPPLSEDRLIQSHQLRSIIEVGGHFPSTVDYAVCFSRGIRVLSCAPAFGPQVAEMALGLTLSASRGMVASHVEFQSGREVWQGDRPTDFTLFDQQVGFVGFGALARNLLPLLAPFRCRVKVYDPWLPPSLISHFNCIPTGLDDLLGSCRVVYVLAAPAPENKELLGAREIACMLPGALLVLISRSHLVDFPALTKALQEGRIQAAIDVFPEEPLPADAPIRQTPNVVLSAHRAASIRKERRMIGRMIVDDLQLMAAGLDPVLLQAAQPEIIRRRIPTAA